MSYSLIGRALLSSRRSKRRGGLDLGLIFALFILSLGVPSGALTLGQTHAETAPRAAQKSMITT